MTLPRSAILALAAVTAFVFLLLYGPLLVPIVSSMFTLSHGSILWDEPSLSAYAALMQNERILDAVQNTLIVGAAAVALAIVVGTLLALHYCSCRSVERELLQFVELRHFL